MDIEDVFELVGVVGQNVATIGFLCALVEVVVLLDKPFQLALDIGDLVAGKLIFVERDPSSLQSKVEEITSRK